tara:strand:- start:1664 stop:1888 length:225 start_codon:yes stop_codon:yes gene_type:complete
MKTIVTKGGIMTWINTRENKFLDEHFKDNTVLEQKQLTERETYIASNLVTRGILDKNIDQKQVTYKLNMNNMVR